MKKLLGASDNGFRKAGQLGGINAVAFQSRSFFEPVLENQFARVFLDQKM